jgi:Mrp family chromosome partitioning ATPase/capsular polysaccharide biosynthesis protein
MAISPDDVTVRDYLRPLFRRRWLVIVIVVMATAATYGYYENQPKDYQASTRILLGGGGNPLDQSAGVLSDREVQDLAGLLSSRDVANGVAKRLGRTGEAGALAGSVKAFASPGSDFVQIKAYQGSAQDAADVANAFAQAFISLRTDAVRKDVTKAVSATQAQLNTLPRTAANKTTRQQLEDNIRQLRLTAAVSNGSATQVDPALPPATASGPRPKRDAGLAFIVALIGAIGLAYALQAFDRRPRQLEELSPLYGMPLLTSVPHVETPEFEHGGQIAVAPAFKEPLRQLRTNIQLAALDQPFQRILVTSAIAGEGKSTVVRNLALVLAEGGLRVAVVDGDLRRPTLAAAFGQEREPGLTDVLTGRHTLAEALVTVPIEVHGLEALARMGVTSDADPQPPAALQPDAGSLSLLPAGPEPPDPQAVLAAERTRSLLQGLSDDFDIVLIDSPPLLHVTDAIAIAPSVDAVVIVARLGHVTRENAKRVPEMLGMAGARPIGIVVNDVPVAESASYGYGYSY